MNNALVVKLADIKDLKRGCPSKLYFNLDFNIFIYVL